MTEIIAAVDLLLRYDERRFGFNLDHHTIRMWLTEGADMEQDILPAMRDCMSKKKDIKHVGYFTPAVRRLRESRVEVEKAKAMKKEGPSDAALAKRYAFLIRTLGKCLPTEARWLDEYEAKNGAV
jgi:ribosomal protein S16